MVSIKLNKVKIDELVSPIWNPRKISDRKKEKLKRSIDEYGYISPVIVNKVNNHIVGGNQRVSILKSLGYDMIDVVYIDEPDLDREKALNLSLNKVNGDWDIGKLEDLLVDLELNDVDLDLTGFDKLDFKEFDFDVSFNVGSDKGVVPINDNPIRDEVIIEENHSKSQKEEEEIIFPLKEDNVSLFDSIEYEDDTVTVFGEEETNTIEKENVPIVETETSNEPIEKEEDEIIESIEDIQTTIQKGDVFQLGEHRLMCGDCTNPKDMKQLMKDTFVDTIFTDPPYDLDDYSYADIIDEYSKDTNVFIMNSDTHSIEYLKQSKLNFIQFIIADFMFCIPRQNRPYLQHILVSHEVKGDATHCRNLHKGLRSIIKMKYRGFIKEDKTIHKHQKSVEFVKSILEHYSNENVLDIFGGSGTTLIACQELGLKCFMMEIEPKFVQVIINRWENLTGEKAIKLN